MHESHSSRLGEVHPMKAKNHRATGPSSAVTSQDVGSSSDRSATNCAVFVAYGFHPPWNEACINIARCMIQEIKSADDGRGQIDQMHVFSIKRAVPKSTFPPIIEQARMHYISIPWPLQFFIGSEVSMPKPLWFFVHIYCAFLLVLQLARLRLNVRLTVLINVNPIAYVPVLRMFLRSTVAVLVSTRPSRYHLLLRHNVDCYLCTACRHLLTLSLQGIEAARLLAYPPPTSLDRGQVASFGRLNRIHEPVVITYLGSISTTRLPPSVIQSFGLSPTNHKIIFRIIVPETPSSREYLATTRGLLEQTRGVSVTMANLSDNERLEAYVSSDFICAPFSDGDVIVTAPPLALIEAMQAGCVPVVTRSSAMDEIVIHGYNGMIIENPNDIWEVVSRMSPQKRMKLSAHAAESASLMRQKRYAAYLNLLRLLEESK